MKFMGYRRSDGRVGTRNYVGVSLQSSAPMRWRALSPRRSRRGASLIYADRIASPEASRSSSTATTTCSRPSRSRSWHSAPFLPEVRDGKDLRPRGRGQQRPAAGARPGGPTWTADPRRAAAERQDDLRRGGRIRESALGRVRRPQPVICSKPTWCTPPTALSTRRGRRSVILGVRGELYVELTASAAPSGTTAPATRARSCRIRHCKVVDLLQTQPDLGRVTSRFLRRGRPADAATLDLIRGSR